MTSTHVLHPPTSTLDKVHASSEGKGPRTMALASFPPKKDPGFPHPSVIRFQQKTPISRKKSWSWVMLGATQVILWYGRKAKSFDIAVGKVLLVSGKYLSAEKCREFSPYSTWSNMRVQGASACNFLDVNYRYHNHPSVARISNLWTDAEDDCRGFRFSLHTRDSNSK